MRVALFVLGAVEMSDAGPGPRAPVDLRYSQAHFRQAQARVLDRGVRADRLGYGGRLGVVGGQLSVADQLSGS